MRESALIACVVAWSGCGDPVVNPDDTTSMATSTVTTEAPSSSTTGSPPSTTSGSTSTVDSTTGITTGSADTTAGMPLACDLGDYECPEGQACSQLDFLEPPSCGPIPEGACAAPGSCPEGFECQQGSTHSEIGECVPLETGSSSGGSGGGSTTAG